MPSKFGRAVTQMHCSVERPLPRSSHLVAHIPDPITQASLVTLVAGSVVGKICISEQLVKTRGGRGPTSCCFGAYSPV